MIEYIKVPMKEELLFKSNGQWELLDKKQKYDDFNPMDPKYTEHRKLLQEWLSEEGKPKDQSIRRKLEFPDTVTHLRAIKRLAGMTNVRKNPDTNEYEMLMHRGIGQEERSKAAGQSHVTTDDHSSWTPEYTQAYDFASDYLKTGDIGDVDTHNKVKNHVVSAWIPVSKIQHYPNIMGHTDERDASKIGANPYRFEHETIIKPGKFENAKVEEVKPQMKDVEERYEFEQPQVAKKKLKGV